MKTSADTSYNRTPRLSAWALLALFIAMLAMEACSTSPRFDGYRKEGYAVASWYGPQFHGLLTASGERYNMDALTCAHKTLPFGTRLKVTGVDSSKSVTVTVTDRGPFIEGRDLDLSRAAAKKIGIFEVGVGKVFIDVLGRDNRYIKYLAGDTLQKSAKGPFTIQVAAFVEPENATHLKRGLEINHKDGAVYIMEKVVEGKKFYRVRIGKFDSQNAARKYAENLAEEGYAVNVAPYEL